MRKYEIWDKKTPVIMPSGQVLTPEEYMEMFPMFKLDHITAICRAGEVGGSFYSTLGQLVYRYTERGCDFTGCETAEEKLAAIEAFDDAQEKAEAEALAEAKAREDMQADSLVSIAASLEYQNMMTLPDVEE